jgi:NADPH:quinone reductase-like Zn-dependent oxidoreductase
VLQKPEHLGWEEAAALTLDHLTAWRMLMTRAAVRPGETVLINGVGGGAALAGLQIARLAGCRTIVTSSSDDKLARASELGADHGLNYKTTGDMAMAVRGLTGGRGADVIFDTVGAATLQANMGAIRRGGRIVNCGVTGGAQGQLNMQALYWNQVSILGSTMGSDDDFRQMLAAVSQAKLRPVIDSVYPLEEIQAATERLEAGLQFGKIVVTV